MVCAENVTGLKHSTEAADQFIDGRRALCTYRRVDVSSSGVYTRDHADMSSDKAVRNPLADSPRIPE